jgi:hypothetical protein
MIGENMGRKKKVVQATNDLCEIIFIMDKSGSMDTIKKDAIGGFNSFLATQQSQGDNALLTLVLFDSEVKTVYNGFLIKNAKPLDEKTYYPSGTTALCDAIGLTLDKVGARMSEPGATIPDKVIVAILTDGEENASKEYIGEGRVSEMIKTYQEKYDWEFLFLAANQDAIKSAAKYNIAADRSMSFNFNAAGANAVYTTLCNTVSDYRSTGKVDLTTGGENVSE